MSFKSYDDFANASLRLPIKGKMYVIPSPDAATGLFCQRLMAVGTSAALGQEPEGDTVDAILSDDDERDLYRRLLGPAWDEMIADDVPWMVMQHAGTTAMVWVTNGWNAAEEYWNRQGPDPKAEAKQPQDHKPKAEDRSAPTGSTDATTRNQPKKTSRATRGQSS